MRLIASKDIFSAFIVCKGMFSGLIDSKIHFLDLLTLKVYVLGVALSQVIFHNIVNLTNVCGLVENKGFETIGSNCYIFRVHGFCTIFFLDTLG